MKLVWFVYSDGEAGEVEGMFDDKENLLDTWCNNDANWRGEYFDGFMKAVGVDVQDAKGARRKRLEKKLIERWL